MRRYDDRALRAGPVFACSLLLGGLNEGGGGDDGGCGDGVNRRLDIRCEAR